MAGVAVDEDVAAIKVAVDDAQGRGCGGARGPRGSGAPTSSAP